MRGQQDGSFGTGTSKPWQWSEFISRTHVWENRTESYRFYPLTSTQVPRHSCVHMPTALTQWMIVSMQWYHFHILSLVGFIFISLQSDSQGMTTLTVKYVKSITVRSYYESYNNLNVLFTCSYWVEWGFLLWSIQLELLWPSLRKVDKFTKNHLLTEWHIWCVCLCN